MTRLITLALFALLLIFLFNTCPTKKDHKKELRDDITELISKELESQNIKNDLTGNPEFKDMIENLAVAAVDVDNYFLFSIGKVDLGGKEQVVSFGIGGHVFTFNDKVVRKAADIVTQWR